MYARGRRTIRSASMARRFRNGRGSARSDRSIHTFGKWMRMTGWGRAGALNEVNDRRGLHSRS